MSAESYLPESLTLAAMREAVQRCEGCELYRDATQAVFGEGLKKSRILMIGEQPGDQEDRQGQPFVGPAGAVLDDALAEAGINRKDVYVTNTVKHFKWEPRGKRRLHKKPSAREITACRPWLDGELQVVQPDVVVCLGATAAQAVIGRSFRITRQHGEVIATDASEHTLATYHPSAVLRARTSEAREEMRQALVADLRTAAGLL